MPTIHLSLELISFNRDLTLGKCRRPSDNLLYLCAELGGKTVSRCRCEVIVELCCAICCFGFEIRGTGLFPQ